MTIARYFLAKEIAGVVDGARYIIQDNEYTFRAWRSLQKDFATQFQQFDPSKDYELPEWHHEMHHLWVFLYNSQFYNSGFIPRVLSILSRHGDCYAVFECYDDALKYMGHIQVYRDGLVRINEIAVSTGLARLLCGEAEIREEGPPNQAL